MPVVPIPVRVDEDDTEKFVGLIDDAARHFWYGRAQKKRFRFGGGVIFKSTNQIKYHANAIFTHRATPLTKEVIHSLIPFYIRLFCAVKSL